MTLDHSIKLLCHQYSLSNHAFISTFEKKIQLPLQKFNFFWIHIVNSLES